MLSSWCKSCQIKSSQKYRKLHEDKYKEYDKMRYHSMVDYNKKRYKKYRASNLDQYKKWQKDWRQNNKVKLRQYTNQRAAKNHNISQLEWSSCKSYFNNCCAYCGIPDEEAKELHGQYLHKEHVNPNGASDLSNCIPACRICNSEKHTNNFEEWYNPSNPKYNTLRVNMIQNWLNGDYKNYIEEP